MIKLSIKELRKLPVRDLLDTNKLYDHILIINSGKKHDSGYALMAIVGVNYDTENKKYLMEISAYCDDLHLKISDKIIPYQWKGFIEPVVRTDMYTTGVLRYWSNHGKFVVGMSLSSLDVYLVRELQDYEDIYK